MKNGFIKPIIDAMSPKRRPGALPKVTPCPYCKKSMSQTGHANHAKQCLQDFQDAPPQAADFMHDAGGGYNSDRSFPQT